MNAPDITITTVCVVGLGYVGYPLACAFAEQIRTIGYDVDAKKIATINTSPGNRIEGTTDPARIREADVVIIAVPTPVTKAKDPDLSYIVSAGETVGKHMKPGAIVVLESTVYPGLTEEVFVPVLEQVSGMACGRDFFVGYSPERINPGDDEHTLEKITKIVSGMDEATAATLAKLYGRITTVHLAPDIRTAEAAKVIENVQRDLNIALMNELSIIFGRMGIDTKAVLDAAGTKWNFHHYRPGLVGGHCIPVDPYYLVMKAEELGYHPQVILAGRAINDSMPRHVAGIAIKELNRSGKVIKGSKVLIMGLTYKENVPDTRESPVEEMVKEFEDFHLKVYGFDPLLSPDQIEHFGAKAVEQLDSGMQVDCIVVNAPHDAFRKLAVEDLLAICNGKPVVVDVAGVFRECGEMRDGCYYRVL
ncbi:nucleotide sugar dehydrogenase [Methanocalculus taiwanensis]|uniref:UDP-N-acetyl-D-mannosamine dehydrogenase n=1 Tax=Methanocalculus taiwanensis TaxID=106207 RepID=A0ABD4TI70_9EURY|nr:nucleotide sugar dehydrogenase [Methanocalculus taiwanensis]MCQ1538181.1 nucleotide sugar dehydrogenase [Methanocalculus taiwanensis]